MAEEPFISKLGDELAQSPKYRQELLRRLGKAIGRTAVSFFTSFTYPVMIEEGDAELALVHAGNKLTADELGQVERTDKQGEHAEGDENAVA